jgi:hypothetical protein
MASLAEMRARLQQLNQRTGKKQNDIWKAKDEHDVRLLPDPRGPEHDPFVILVFHYELGGASCLCPLKNFGKPCKVCDFCEKLRAWKGPDGEDKAEGDRKADFEIFKKIQPTEKAFVRLVERMKDGTLSPDGPKWWSPGFTNNNKLIDLMSNTERMEMLDLDPTDDASGFKVLFDMNKAFDIHIRFSDAAGKPLAKGNKKNRPMTEITEASMKGRPVTKDKEELKKLLTSIKPIGEVYPEQSSEEVAILLDKFIGGGSAEAKSEGGTEKYEANSGEDTGGLKGGKSIDEAFGETVDENAAS